MRHENSSRRQRGRGNGARRGNQKRTSVYDSNGPDVRIRGTAHQVAEKYINLAKDASASGEHILAESYLQHAEHYQRIINESMAENQQRSQNRANKASADGNRSQPKPEKKNDDLGLPSSILGVEAEPKSQNEDTRTSEMASA